jgi:AcrR family transcriptional regulator
VAQVRAGVTPVDQATVDRATVDRATARADGARSGEPGAGGRPGEPELQVDGGRALRADARRNRQNVLAAAEAVFASQGIGAPIDEVALLAKVGVGTVYRHFPTKESLYEAVVVDRMERLLTEIRETGEAADPGEALFSALARIVEVAASKRDLADALARAGIDLKAAAAGPFEELQREVGTLLQRAQACGAARSDVDASDLIALVSGACMAAEHQACTDGARKLTGILCDGLRSHTPV